MTSDETLVDIRERSFSLIRLRDWWKDRVVEDEDALLHLQLIRKIDQNEGFIFPNEEELP